MGLIHPVTCHRSTDRARTEHRRFARKFIGADASSAGASGSLKTSDCLGLGSTVSRPPTGQLTVPCSLSVLQVPPIAGCQPQCRGILEVLPHASVHYISMGGETGCV